MTGPLVSIVTPSLNQGRFIRATIESVLAQDYPHIEYIVMDGGSTDGTAAIAREYGSRLTWISEPDRGQSHAINKGFRLAKGGIVSWLNSDDVILRGAVRHAVNGFERRPEAGAVYGEGYLINAEGRLTGRFPATEPFNLWKLIHLSDYVLQQTLYFRKDVLDEAGYLDESLRYTMDWDILIRVGQRYRLEYIPEPMGCLRQYPEAKSFAGGRERIAEIRRVLRRHTGLRCPPGWITYGLDTLQNYCKDRLERRSPAWLRAPATVLSLLIYAATAYGIMRILRDAQGWYPDGWAADRVKWMLPPGGGSFLVRGRVPEQERRLEGQVLTVLEGGRVLKQARLGPGQFELRVPFEEVCTEPIRLELRASRFMRPRPGSEASLRRLAYILTGVDWAEGS